MGIGNKRSFILKVFSLCIALFLFSQPLSAFANNAYEPILDADKAEESGNKPGIIEKQLSKLLINFGNWIIDISKAQDVSVLTFQRPDIIQDSNGTLSNTSSADRPNMYFGIFPEGLFNGIAAFYDYFTSLLPIPMMILLTGGGLFLLFDIMKSNEVRSKAKEILFGIILAILMVQYGHIIWGWIIDINYVIVDSIYVVLHERGIVITRFTDTIWDSSQYSELSASQSIGVAILLIVAIFMTFVINYQYMMRMLQLAMLIILFPFTILSAMIPSRKSALNVWFTAFTSNVFMQAGHAVALGLFFYSLSNASSMSFWLVMTMLFGLPAMADVVSRIVGAFTGEGGGGGMKTSAMNMSGMAGMMAISKVGSTIAGGKGKSSSDKAKADSSDGRNSTASTDWSSFTDNNGNSGSASNDNRSESIVQNSGSAPTSAGINGVGSSNKAKGVSAVAKGVSQGGRFLANSKHANAAVRGAAVIGASGIGFIGSTMTTGNGGVGAYMGAKVGKGVGSAGNYAREKIGKATEYIGESARGKIEHNAGFIDNPNQYTNERLGFDDEAQLYDGQEMSNMGEELIGGRTGRVVGATTAKLNELYTELVGNDEQKEALFNAREKRNLGEQVLHSRGMQQELGSQLETAKLQHNHINSQFGENSEEGEKWREQKQAEYEVAKRNYDSNPNVSQYREEFEEAKKNLKAPHPEVQKSQQLVNNAQANYNKQAYETRQLEDKYKNYYKILKQAKEMQNYQNNNVRSSGEL